MVEKKGMLRHMPKKILLVFGTRPEAIKMAPLVIELKKQSSLDIKICVTGQHREMLDQVLDLFQLKPDFDLNVMKSQQTLSSISISILEGLNSVFNEFIPDWVLVHGDTATTFSAALASYYNQIKVGHVEAGLRTGDIRSPWPEEGNRKLTAAICDVHFAPTVSAKNNLISENVSKDRILVTGNTVVDALQSINNVIESNIEIRSNLHEKFSFLSSEERLVLITGHRRENFGDSFINICKSIKELASANPDVRFVYPVHLNPNVQGPVQSILQGIDNVHLIQPLEYLEFVFLMSSSYLILTDSGGIQEEAPSLGKPVLVMRDTTERPEAVEAGTVILVGTNQQNITNNVQKLLDNKQAYEKMSKAHNPYGDGTASKQIVNWLLK